MKTGATDFFKKVLFMLVGILIGAVLCFSLVDAFIFRGNIEAHIKLSAVGDVLDEYFLYDYDKKDFADMSAAGAVLSVNDPYTVYYSKEDFEAMRASSGGNMVGIGVTVIKNDNNEIEITDVETNSPAYEAGLMPGDIILKVDQKAYSGDELNQAAAYMRGVDADAGTDITLLVRRGKDELTIQVTRRKIHRESVSYKLISGNIGYIKIDAFNIASDSGKSTADEFKSAVNLLISDGAGSLIFDVRNNGGGDAKVVCDMLDFLLPEGVVMYTEDKAGKRENYTSAPGGIDLPMAVITNSQSASASEVFTGALRDYEKATVVGEKTFGKGVVQAIVKLYDGSGVRVTEAEYYTPNGTNVQGNGISPDIEVKQDIKLSLGEPNPEADMQLKTAIEVLSK